jgi:hypothetical protein
MSQHRSDYQRDSTSIPDILAQLEADLDDLDWPNKLMTVMKLTTERFLTSLSRADRIVLDQDLETSDRLTDITRAYSKRQQENLDNLLLD